MQGAVPEDLRDRRIQGSKGAVGIAVQTRGLRGTLVKQPQVTFLADGHSLGIHQCYSWIKGAVGTLVGALPRS